MLEPIYPAQGDPNHEGEIVDKAHFYNEPTEPPHIDDRTINNLITKATSQHLAPEDFYRQFSVPELTQLSEPQRVILRAVENILYGKEQDVSSDDLQFTDSFARIFFSPTPETSKDAEIAMEIDPLKDEQLSTLMKNHLAKRIGSPLQTERAKFGITEPAKEKPFEICVVSVEEEAKAAIWNKVAGKETRMFVLNSIFIDGKKKPPVIYISAHSAKSIIYRGNPGEILDLRHEYRHTQRNSLYEQQGRLFQFLDEAMTSIENQYAATRVALQFLTMTTADLTNNDFLKAHESGDEHKKAECLEKWVQAFGPKGLLLLGASYNAEYPLPILGEFSNLPFFPKIESENLRIPYFETLLTLREKANPHWRNIFIKRLQDPNLHLRILKIWLDPILLEICDGIEKTQANHLKELLQLIRDEIARREQDYP